jgi:hypothetical protein
MRPRFVIAIATVAASLALLVPASSASAATGFSNWCNNQSVGYVVDPGKVCTWYPVTTAQVSTGWDVKGPGSGKVCVAILQYPWPNGKMVPLDDFGRPTDWTCNYLRQSGNPASTWNLAYRDVTQGFGAVYGQPALLNFSTAKIQVRVDQLNWVKYYY